MIEASVNAARNIFLIGILLIHSKYYTAKLDIKMQKGDASGIALITF